VVLAVVPFEARARSGLRQAQYSSTVDLGASFVGVV